MPAFFSRSYFCDLCNVAYNDKLDHRCDVKCPCCYAEPSCEGNKNILCQDCNRYFKNEQCFKQHKEMHTLKNKKIKTTSICNRVQRCKKCNRHERRAHLKKHKCGYFDCRVCKQQVEKEGETFTKFNRNVILK